jgi:hypothetical protein
MDEAFYSILGRDLVATGTEAFYSPSGFGAPPGLPAQNWYHWGELWLAGGIGRAFALEPSFARHLVALPLLLLGIVSLVGSIARRGGGMRSRAVFIFGAAIGMALAPIPVPLADTFFSTWPSGLLFHVTEYGVVALLVPLLMLLVLRGGDIPADRAPSVLFVAALAAMLLPAHVALALLAGAGVLVSIAALAIQLRLEEGRIPGPPRAVLLMTASIVAMGALTFAWGTVTGHGVVGSGSSSLALPFNHIWRVAMGTALVGAAAFLTIPVAWLVVRRRRHELAALLLGVLAIVAGGAFAWGALIGEFTMFHAFYGALTLFATPMAAAAIVVVWSRLRERGRKLAALVVIVGAVVQVEVGILSSVNHLFEFGPYAYPSIPPIPLEVMASIGSLEPEAKIGYACRDEEEIVFWDARLLSIDLHTGRRIVPLCYEANVFAEATGASGAAEEVGPQFRFAPQFELFPNANARPTPEKVVAWMKGKGIGYLFADKGHPNTLVPDAIPMIVRGDTQLLRLP